MPGLRNQKKNQKSNYWFSKNTKIIFRVPRAPKKLGLCSERISFFRRPGPPGGPRARKNRILSNFWKIRKLLKKSLFLTSLMMIFSAASAYLGLPMNLRAISPSSASDPGVLVLHEFNILPSMDDMFTPFIKECVFVLFVFFYLIKTDFFRDMVF